VGKVKNAGEQIKEKEAKAVFKTIVVRPHLNVEQN